MRDATENSRFQAIRAILLKQWDPIGIVELGGPNDEYDSYVWPIIAMIDGGANSSGLAAHLLDIETSRMGLNGDIVRCRTTAEAIVRTRA